MIEVNKNTIEQSIDLSKTDKVILIDFSNMMLVYANVFQHLSSTINGVVNHTGILYGLTQLVTKILTIHPNATIIFCIESGHGNRKEIYPEYKSNRVESEEKKNIFSYKNKVMSVLSVIDNVYFAEGVGYEGDDTISVLAFSFLELGKDTIVYSRDNDFLQLMKYGVKVSNKLDGNTIELVTEDFVHEKYGVTSQNLLYYRVLDGDTSDNISKPVKGLKSAFKVKFISFWGDTTFDNALKIMHPLHPKEVAKLNTTEARESIKVNLKLMDLSKYRKTEFQFPIHIFKGDKALSKTYIQEFKLRQYQNFLNIRYPNYGF